MKSFLITIGAFLLLTTSVSAKTAGSVNGIEITVKEANDVLNMLTKGKAKWDTLSKKEKKELIHMMAPTKLVAAESKKSLTSKERETALSSFWMQKKMAEVKISDADIKNAYEKIKKASKSKQKLPSLENVAPTLKVQLQQEGVIKEIMKKAKINIK